MNLQFKNPHGAISPKLQRRIEQKLTKLSRLTDSGASSANAFFEMERAVGSHQSGNVWQATINIDTNGNRFNASVLEETPEKAAAKALQEIRTELKKFRSRARAISRREGGFWKSLQRRFTRS